MSIAPPPPPETREPPEAPAIPDVLPVLPLRDAVVYPLAILPLAVGQERTLRLVDDVMRGDRLLVLIAQRAPEVEAPGPADLYDVGTVATIRQLLRGRDGTVRLAVQGLERVRLVEFTATEPYLVARVRPDPDERAAPGEPVVVTDLVPGTPEPGTPEPAAPEPELEGLRRAVIDLFRQVATLVPDLPQELVPAAEALADPLQVVYLVGAALPFPLPSRQELLETEPLAAKLRLLVDLLQHELAVRELGRRIQAETQERMTRQQRDFLLREQLRSIQSALGEGGEGQETADLRRRLESAGLPEEARREAERELQRLETISQASPEGGIIRTYLEWMVTLPWSALTGGEIDVARARAVLDEDHYDLQEVKDRILEYLAVKKLRRQRQAAVGLAGAGEAGTVAQAGPLPETGVGQGPGGGSDRLAGADEAGREPILCFVGPPGVGKTSLGQSIARALGRKFVRMSLGGVRDEAEIRGHRRTYIGALPGRVIQALRRTETRDPVFMLDEIDKLASDWRGDPTAALLEVLDPAQNHAFVDTYLGVPFDLSQVLFIATANTLDTIPAPLLDRMEVLRIAGYTEDEKVHIAQRYLLPQQRAAHGLRQEELEVTDEAVRAVVRGYTREAGVRNLDRQLATICRKVAREIAEATDRAQTQDGHPVERVVVTPDRLESHLGRRRFFDEVAERTDRPGVATGLAWTPVGGEVLFVEAAMMPDAPGTGQRLILTGMLGDVMRESAQAALTYLRSDAARLGIDPGVFAGQTVHVHVPAGATPKDGPSAGVAILAALASIASGRPVRKDVAMTGEITLRGAVLPVGGIKEKVLAAHRAGARTVLLPRQNDRDLDDVPEELRRSMEFVLLDSGAQAIERALSPAAGGATPSPGSGTKSPGSNKTR
jgi:ATP-dependent Lon protease